MVIERVVQMYRRNKFSLDRENNNNCEWETESKNNDAANNREPSSYTYLVVVQQGSATNGIFQLNADRIRSSVQFSNNSIIANASR